MQKFWFGHSYIQKNTRSMKSVGNIEIHYISQVSDKLVALEMENIESIENGNIDKGQPSKIVN